MRRKCRETPDSLVIIWLIRYVLFEKFGCRAVEWLTGLRQVLEGDKAALSIRGLSSKVVKGDNRGVEDVDR